VTARYRGRFAPSPTGPLHFGSLIAAVASYADARAHGGEWLLRIEDVDVPRTRADSEADILATLARYGFEWDSDVVRQSDRVARYEEALTVLRARGIAYECACTRLDLQRAPLGDIGERVYPGTCARGIPAHLATRHAHATRVRVPVEAIAFTDGLQGTHAQRLAQDVGDFIVKRADGLFAYQLAVVVDDADAGVTHVVRGADLLASTPRQIFLQRALSLPTPSYLHVPVAISVRGEKLSKQTHAAALPDDPLPALVAAWRLLDQPPATRPMGSAAMFWRHAERAWSRPRLPPVRMLPSPPAFDPCIAFRHGRA